MHRWRRPIPGVFFRSVFRFLIFSLNTFRLPHIHTVVRPNVPLWKNRDTVFTGRVLFFLFYAYVHCFQPNPWPNRVSSECGFPLERTEFCGTWIFPPVHFGTAVDVPRVRPTEINTGLGLKIVQPFAVRSPVRLGNQQKRTDCSQVAWDTQYIRLQPRFTHAPRPQFTRRTAVATYDVSSFDKRYKHSWPLRLTRLLFRRVDMI